LTYLYSSFDHKSPHPVQTQLYKAIGTNDQSTVPNGADATTARIQILIIGYGGRASSGPARARRDEQRSRFLCVAVGAEERQVAGDAAGEMRALLSWAPRASPAAPRPRVRVRVASSALPAWAATSCCCMAMSLSYISLSVLVGGALEGRDCCAPMGTWQRPAVVARLQVWGWG